MVLLQIHPGQLTMEERDSEKQKVTSYLLQRATEDHSTISTILWQESDSQNNGIPESIPLEILTGSGRISENLRCLSTGNVFRFEISPMAFFQSSTLACEKLFDLVAQWTCNEAKVEVTEAEGAAAQKTPQEVTKDDVETAVKESEQEKKDLEQEKKECEAEQGDPETETKQIEEAVQVPSDSQPKQKKILLLDLCCGTGTIGIVMSKLERIHKIIGVELCEEALEDAKRNATQNGLGGDRVEYICDKVEQALPTILRRLQSNATSDVEVVAVLDPPRAGVHKSVVHGIRSSPLIHRLIYVSCNPDAALQNWLE